MLTNLITGRLANTVIALVNVVLLIFNVRTVNSAKPQVNPSGYRLVWSDDFDGNSVDPTIWNVDARNGVRKGGYWHKDQCRVKDGYLVITTEYKENGVYGAGWYTGSLLSMNKKEQAYGYYECRCKLPKGQGLWSAFWLTCAGASKVNGTGKLGAEIDVFESPFGYKTGKDAWKVTSNIHYNGYDLQTRYQNVVISALDNDPYENFNTYGLLWTPDEYVFYINGREVGRSSFGGVSQVPEYVVLSCEVDGAAATPTFGWSGDIRNNRDGKNFTSEFVVDYVKVYALS